jgi:ATP-dependent DNA helicase RecQ
LVRLDYLSQDPERFNVVELTPGGLEVLRSRQAVTLTRPMAQPKTARHRAGAIACDELLFDKLRVLRKALADERGVPAYVIFGDVALRQMARSYPQDEEAFSGISGVGESKRREFGEAFVAEITAHLSANDRRVFEDDVAGAAGR